MEAASNELLTPGEVADLLGINPKTLSDWADRGKLPSIRTPGGYRRYKATEIGRFMSNRRGTRP